MASYPYPVDGIDLGSVALGYDAVRCLASIKVWIETAGQPFNAETFREALNSVTCHGITGDINFSGSRLSTKRETVLIFKDGKLQPAIDQDRIARPTRG